MFSKSIRAWSVVFICVAAFATATCGSSSPSAPTPTPAPAPPPPPAPTPPPGPAAKGSVQVSIVPSPVPYSGLPITDAAGCAASKNTWFYEEVIKEVGGAAVTITAEDNFFDGALVNHKVGLTMVVPALGSMTLRRRWCSANAAAHTAQAAFGGFDVNGNTFTGTAPIAGLMAK